MTQESPSCAARDISDTARWVACFRSQETERSDALFHDVYAKRLAGERGFAIAKGLTDGTKHQWGWATRTYLFDQFILAAIEEGADLVVNLAAGLDARPYRLQLSGTVRWVEVDLPDILSYKEEVLGSERPQCRLERIRLDLSSAPARRSLFAELNREAGRAVVVSEGFLLYLDAEEVGSLARDLAVCRNFRSWIVDLTSKGQLRLMQRAMGAQLSAVGAPFKFAPTAGPRFFEQFGWTVADVRGVLKTAAQLDRLPPELHALLPEPTEVPVNYPWSGVCLLTATGAGSE